MLPIGSHTDIESYCSRALSASVQLLRAVPLTESSRAAPWRLDLSVDGEARSFVLRLNARNLEHEYRLLRAMEPIPIPTPRAFGWDSTGESLGAPCFLSDFLEGESLLAPMLAGEAWAEDLYLDTVCALQTITRQQLGDAARWLDPGESAADVLEIGHAYFQVHHQPLADRVYAQLLNTMPALPATRFSNGDLWPDNLLIRDRQLAGVIDFEHAGFSDPIFEFLLPFFVRPDLRGRGLEKRYCQRMGFDPDLLPWYRGLELFDTWHLVLKHGQSFEQYTPEYLVERCELWLSSPE